MEQPVVATMPKLTQETTGAIRCTMGPSKEMQRTNATAHTVKWKAGATGTTTRFAVLAVIIA